MDLLYSMQIYDIQKIKRFSNITQIINQIYVAYDNQLKKKVVLKYYKYRPKDRGFTLNEHEKNILLHLNNVSVISDKNINIIQLYDSVKIPIKLCVSEINNIPIFNIDNDNVNNVATLQCEANLLILEKLETDLFLHLNRHPNFYNNKNNSNSIDINNINNNHNNHNDTKEEEEEKEKKEKASLTTRWKIFNRFKKLIFNMMKAVKYCHDRNIAHRDIKLDNFVFVDNGDDYDDNNAEDEKDPYTNIKLIDFGLACHINPSKEDLKNDTYYVSNTHRVLSGTSGYFAPELLLVELNSYQNDSDDSDDNDGDIWSQKYSHFLDRDLDMKKTDIWSLAITILCTIDFNFIFNSPIMNTTTTNKNNICKIGCDAELENTFKTFGFPTFGFEPSPVVASSSGVCKILTHSEWPEYYKSGFYRNCRELYERQCEIFTKIYMNQLPYITSIENFVNQNFGHYDGDCMKEDDQLYKSQLNNLSHLLNIMLSYNPKVRPTIDDLITHPLFSSTSSV
jgi:serine/threonine protein kinase